MSSDSASSQPLLSHGSNSQGHHPHQSPRPLSRTYKYCRSRVARFLSSTAQHYFVLALVSLDLLSIFADIIITLHQCDYPTATPAWDQVRNVLGIAGLVFSCLFMVELMMNIWIFGLRYFGSTFHIFDATVIVAGFIIDVLLKGVLEEVASLVVILRLWRFFKIIEEFTVGAQEQMDGLEMRIEQLETENQDLKRELKKWKGSRDD
ncbi:hypothetical protein BJ875DRAFT_15155 [Amylocarpus encephaloides]|uniref:Voltage-gated hydrogen channel 1 n=1 Tax=Amylocarpus encephaloides TaxID=45428 RepID=A0A9P8C5N0_9HELO|nr:hypothetical protein BJ875DRAFT_15155 [Amylocarpus encephaloides]